jgi:hypothetical protein
MHFQKLKMHFQKLKMHFQKLKIHIQNLGSPSRDSIDLPTTKSQVPKAFYAEHVTPLPD